MGGEMSFILSDPEPVVVFVDAIVMRQSEKALLVRLQDGEQGWVPKSRLLRLTTVKRAGDKGMLCIPYWLAQKKGLMDTGNPKKSSKKQAQSKSKRRSGHR